MPDSEAPSGITTGELSRAVSLIRHDIGVLHQALASRPDKDDLRRVEDGLIERIRAAAELQELRNQLQDRSIIAIEGWQTWALRLGAPALLGSVVGVLINGSRIGS